MAAHSGTRAARQSSTPVTSPPSCRRSCREIPSLTRSTAWPGPPRRCSIWQWRTSGSTSWSARGWGHLDSTGVGAVHPGRGDHRSGLLPNPLRDRFGFTAHLGLYADHELEEVLGRAAALLELEVAPNALAEIAGRCRGTPRIANRLLRRVRDYCLVHSTSGIDAVRAALELYEVDGLGLDRLDRAVMQIILSRFGGGPVGPQHPGGVGGRGGRDDRVGGRTVPRTDRNADQNAARPGRPPRPHGSTSGWRTPPRASSAMTYNYKLAHSARH